MSCFSVQKNNLLSLFRELTNSFPATFAHLRTWKIGFTSSVSHWCEKSPLRTERYQHSSCSSVMYVPQDPGHLVYFFFCRSWRNRACLFWSCFTIRTNRRPSKSSGVWSRNSWCRREVCVCVCVNKRPLELLIYLSTYVVVRWRQVLSHLWRPMESSLLTHFIT